jgi:hypothetical protein
MDFDAMAYPEIITIAGVEYKARRNMSKGEVRIPYTNEPDVGIGDVIIQKSGSREIALKVFDVSFLKGGSLEVGTEHPHMLTLKIENTTASSHKTPSQSSTFNIGLVSGDQVGNNNSQIVSISIQHLVEKIAKSSAPEAKSLIKKLLENNTVGSLIGAGVSALLGLL